MQRPPRYVPRTQSSRAPWIVGLMALALAALLVLSGRWRAPSPGEPLPGPLPAPAPLARDWRGTWTVVEHRLPERVGRRVEITDRTYTFQGLGSWEYTHVEPGKVKIGWTVTSYWWDGDDLLFPAPGEDETKPMRLRRRD